MMNIQLATTMMTPYKTNIDEFNKPKAFLSDFKKLDKRYKTLKTDIRRLEDALDMAPFLERKHTNPIYEAQSGRYVIVKSRMRCGGMSKGSLRVIYAYWEVERRIDFIELYQHDDQKNTHARQRVEDYKQAYGA